MDDFLKRTWLEIDLDAIRGNYQKIRSFVAPEAKVMAVIKADAYGHGVEYTARGDERRWGGLVCRIQSGRGNPGAPSRAR